MKSSLVLLIVSLCSLVVNVFVGLDRPLLWNDEAETAVFGQRVLQFGYPKVDDGKNKVNLTESFDPTVGVDSKTNAYLFPGWTQFYVGAIGVSIASHTTDLYLKTFLTRLPFAILGSVGILVWAYTLSLIISGRERRIRYFSLFVLLMSLTLPMILHVREVRYYSLVILLTGAINMVSISYFVRKRLSLSKYIAIAGVLFFLLFNTHYLTYFCLLGSYFALGLIIKLRFKAKGRQIFKIMTLLTSVSIISVLPLIIFFQTLSTASVLARLRFNSTPASYISNLVRIVMFMFRYGQLVPILVVLTSIAGLKKMQDKRLEICGVLVFLIAAYTLAVAITPSILLSQRYYLTIIPLCISLLLIGISYLTEQFGAKFVRLVRVDVIAVIIFALVALVPNIALHAYELNHTYLGPLDYVIPYIQTKYIHPEDLVIATNYEEPSYIYYLGSKVVVGYFGKNYFEEQKLTPDIVIIRKNINLSNRMVTEGYLTKYLSSWPYDKVVFPVFDSSVNNNADTGPYSPRHMFQTLLAKDPQKDGVWMYTLIHK